MDVQVEVVSYGICAAAYLMMTVLVVLSRSRNRYKAMLAVAGGLSVAWAGSVLALPMNTASFGASTVLEVLRAAGWMILLGELLRAGEETRAQRLKLAAVAAFGTSCVMIVVGAELAPLSLASSDYLWIAGRVSGAARLMLAVLGLLLIENLFRNSDEDRRWSVKHLCFGVGGIMAYDFFLYSDAVLFYRIDQTLFQARGIVNALAVPLILISATRSRTWELNLNVSRNVVFHSAALLGSGFYLLLMSVAGFYLRKFGGDWGVIFQILFLSGALLILVVIFSSSSMRAQARVWIAKHFFTLTYDYREEWLRFTQTISEGERHMSLHDRIIRAVANILDNTSGGLWVLRAEDRAFLPTAAWNMVGHLPGQKFPALRADHPLARFMQESHWIVDMDAVRAGEGRYKDLEVPGWLREHEKAGLIVPLIHQNGLRAFLVLGLPRAQRNLDWETYDLLKTVGTQAASYLAEEEAANALSDARRLEEFSRRSAFIVHDIKNVVSQMSLMVQNAEKYGDNPEFQKDMLATVGNSVERMTDLLAQFKSTQEAARDRSRPTDLSAFVAEVGAEWRKRKTDLAVAVDRPGIVGRADAEKLSSVLDHLIQNAIEASGVAGAVSLALRAQEGEAWIEVADDGPGMTDEYVRDKLFRPLDSAKDAGYGLGAYQARQLVRDMGGRLEVSTAPGKGTTMRVILTQTEQN